MNINTDLLLTMTDLNTAHKRKIDQSVIAPPKTTLLRQLRPNGNETKKIRLVKKRA